MEPPPVSGARGCRPSSQRSTCTSAARCWCCSPEDADARDAAEAARPGTSARSRSRSFRAAASAGTRASSRRRISSASGRARSTCSPPAGSSARPRRRSRRVAAAAKLARRALELRRRRRAGDRPAWPSSSPSRATSGSERVEERGQFAVRGGIVDVFPTTGREPLRIELFGDEVEAIRAFSPFTQRRCGRWIERRVYPAGRAAARPRPEPTLPGRRATPGHRTTSCRRSIATRPRLSGPRRSRAVWEEESLDAVAPRRRGAARSVPARAEAVRVRGAAARRWPPAGSPRPSRSLPRFVTRRTARRGGVPPPRATRSAPPP